ncbi:MAG: HEPN domain-containing protein [Candidatus Baltobacteraceae bacterium]
MNVDKAARARAWLANAEGDLLAVTRLLDDLPHLACFHAQQAAERALKAVLTHREGDVPLTHLIRELLAACRDSGEVVPNLVERHALSLEKYYVPTRYPDALGWADAASAYDRGDAEEARADATAVVTWAKKRTQT